MWRKKLFTIIGALMLLGPLSPSWASESSNAGEPAAARAGNQTSDVAKLRAEWFRTMAALAEEQGKSEPDVDRIAELQTKLSALRIQWAAVAGGSVRNPVPVACPWGGPGLGLGLGRGPGFAAGFGPGRGPAAGTAPIPRGYGPGWGRGFGPGSGARPGGGPYFVDRNGNGICDYFELRWGW